MSQDQSHGNPSEDCKLITRQTFLRMAAGGVGVCYAAALGYPVYRYLESPIEKAEGAAKVTEVTLPEAGKLVPGSALMFKFGSRPAILIHHKDGTWVALDAVCTHLGCTVQFDPAKNHIFCACHGGIYNPNTGGNISGPPPRPLKQFFVKQAEGAVVVSKNPHPA